MFNGLSSSDESNVSDWSENSKRSFRVSVCLRRYFSDVRARAFVLVRPARRVRWLHERIRSEFGLRGDFCLRCAGHLLPRAEPLGLLRPGELVEVIPLPEAQEANQKGQDAIEKTATIEAEEPQREDNHISSSSYSTNHTVCKGTIPQGHNNAQSVKRDCYEEMLCNVDTESIIESPSVAIDTVDLGVTAQAEAPNIETGDECSLDSLKRHAFALLDVHTRREISDSAAPSPRRVRRRIRRRPRRHHTPTPAALCQSPSLPVAVVAGSAASASTTPRDVMQNEDACSREPRIIHSLNIDNV